MKLKIYDGTPTPPDTLALKLFQISDQEVSLGVVDDEGNYMLDCDGKRASFRLIKEDDDPTPSQNP